MLEAVLLAVAGLATRRMLSNLCLLRRLLPAVMSMSVI